MLLPVVSPGISIAVAGRVGLNESDIAAAPVTRAIQQRRSIGIAMNIIRAITVLLCLGAAVPVWAGSVNAASSLEEDFQRLQGKWVKRARAEEWILNFQTNPLAFQLAISVPEPVFTAARTGFFYEVQEDARGRYFDLGSGDPSLPRQIYYRFDHDKLVLDIPEGPVRGLHTLVREGEATPSHTAWMIGVVILGGVLVVAVILFRSRAKKAAEPGASADGGGMSAVRDM